MRRSLAYLAAWAVATAATVGVSWLGVRVVTRPRTPALSAPLSAPDLWAAAGSSTAPRRSPRPFPSAVAAPSPSVPAGSSVPPRPPSVRPSSASPTVRAVSRPPSPDASWSAVPDGAGGTAYRRTFRTDGGEVSVLCGPNLVRVLSTHPRSGYTVQVTTYAPDSVLVSFIADRRASRVWVRWWNGPFAEVSESVT